MNASEYHPDAGHVAVSYDFFIQLNASIAIIAFLLLHVPSM